MEHEISDLTRQALQGPIAFEALERLVRTTALRIGSEVLETMLNSAEQPIHPSITLPDGTVASYAGKREKTFVCVLGDITLNETATRWIE